jgi:hypothetical protein
MTPRDIDITERDNVIVARDVTCSHRASTRQSCRSSPWSDSTHVGWLNPRPATFGVRCYDIGVTQGGTQNPNRFYYYVPWYACWIWSGIVTCQSKPKCSLLLSICH